MQSIRSSRPPGMQVHAVPESERFVDDTGRRLPWGYDRAPMGDAPQRDEIEKGPFGRGSRRGRNGTSRSRSKTAEPRREEDKFRAENLAAEDAVFGSMRRVVAKDESRRDGIDVDSGTVPLGGLRSGLLEADSEPSEVLLYGFGADLQWAAIDFYERVSSGIILEDYDRQPPGQRYDTSLSLGRAAAQRSISKAAMRKRNRYAGGEHWIKVTFDSRQAAELAIASGPHIIRGYLVYAEPFQNRGPQRDEPVFATQAGAQVTSDVLPKTFSTNAINSSPNGSSTLSSATATATATGAPASSRQSQTYIGNQESPTSSASTLRGIPATQNEQATSQPLQPSSSSASTAFQSQPGSSTQQLQPRRRTIVEGTTRAVLLPADMALAPKQPRGSWSSWVGASEIIGSTVPRNDDGSFDWARASLYWRLFYWLDSLFGTDFCGLRGDD